MTIVNIRGIDRYILLEHLWEAQGEAQAQREGTSINHTFKLDEALSVVRRDGYVAEVCNRPIHVWLFDTDAYELDTTLYDKVAGPGTFSRVVYNLRTR